jgi:hypothetical protein
LRHFSEGDVPEPRNSPIPAVGEKGVEMERDFQAGISDFRNIVDLLVVKLSLKGLPPGQVARLVKDVLNMVNDSGDLLVTEVNQRLAYLGWGEEILDEFTYELIIYLLENEEAHARDSEFYRTRPEPVVQATVPVVLLTGD